MRTITRSRRARLVGVSIVAVALIAPASALGQDEPQMGGSITVAVEGEPASVDPAFDYDFISGYATIAVLLKFLQTHTTMPFVVYRVAVGTGLLVLIGTGAIG